MKCRKDRILDRSPSSAIMSVMNPWPQLQPETKGRERNTDHVTCEGQRREPEEAVGCPCQLLWVHGYRCLADHLTLPGSPSSFVPEHAGSFMPRALAQRPLPAASHPLPGLLLGRPFSSAKALGPAPPLGFSQQLSQVLSFSTALCTHLCHRIYRHAFSCWFTHGSPT